MEPLALWLTLLCLHFWKKKSPTWQKVRPVRTISSRRANSQFAPGGLRVRTARTFWDSQALSKTLPSPFKDTSKPYQIYSVLSLNVIASLKIVQKLNQKNIRTMHTLDFYNFRKQFRPVRLKSPEGATRLQTGVKPPVSRHKTKALKGR